MNEVHIDIQHRIRIRLDERCDRVQAESLSLAAEASSQVLESRPFDIVIQVAGRPAPAIVRRITLDACRLGARRIARVAPEQSAVDEVVDFAEESSALEWLDRK